MREFYIVARRSFWGEFFALGFSTAFQVDRIHNSQMFLSAFTDPVLFSYSLVTAEP